MRSVGGSGDVTLSPCVQPSVNVGSPLYAPVVVGYEWLRDDVLKCRSSLTSVASIIVLQHQVKLANVEDSYKLAVQACGNDDFPFLRAALGCLPFFFVYRCLFEILGVILPLTVFQCALLEHLNVALSQLHPNSWAMVRAFEILFFSSISSQVCWSSCFLPNENI